MDKGQIKKFSQYSRSKLIPDMKKLISFWEKAEKISGGVQVAGHPYDDSLSLKYSSAIDDLKNKLINTSKDKLAEEAAYIWFNRIIALRFMEVNKYLPTRSSLFASSDNSNLPDILKNISSEWNRCGCDENAINQYRNKQDPQSIQELYRLIFVSLCNKLSDDYGFLFSKIDNWTSLLFPTSLFDSNYIINDKINGMLKIVDEDWKEVEIIGWIYQYYISEEKTRLDGSKEKLKNSAEIAASTQLFTPEWIVKYIVHNTVGKLDVKNELGLTHKIKTENTFDYNVSDLSKFKVLDPASGSGHILVRAYDVLKEIYNKRGFADEEIPTRIIRDNLYGFDIDERAHQLACFAILMKAKADDKNIEKHVDITKNIICIKENNNFEHVNEDRYPLVKSFLRVWHNASMYGSLIRIPENLDLEKVKEEFEKFYKEGGLVADSICTREESEVLLHQTELLDDLYDCVIANPPYKGGDKLEAAYFEFLKNNYKEEKSDLFAAFIFRCAELSKIGGFIGMVTMQSWMFNSDYEAFRQKLIQRYLIDSLLQHGPNGFPEISGEVVQTCSFVFKNGDSLDYDGIYIDLTEYKNADTKEGKLLEAINHNNCDYIFLRNQLHFMNIPTFPIVYQMSDAFISTFNQKKVSDVCNPKQGLATSDNNKFLRRWFEVDFTNIGFKLKSCSNSVESGKKWFPHNKGGEFRKRYGNQEYIVNWLNNGAEIKENVLRKYTYLKTPDFVVKNTSFYFKQSIGWSEVSSGNIGFRYYPEGFIFDVTGCSLFFENDHELKYYFGLLNSNIISYIARIISPTYHFTVGKVGSLPVIYNNQYSSSIEGYVNSNIKASKQDRDSFETSWDFKKHPLIEFKGNNDLVLNCFTEWHNKCVERAQTIKNNEEELNKIFNKIYGLEGEIDPTVSYDDITIWKANREKDIKSLLSYIIGCMMGRYSLDQEGLVYAGGEFDKSKYKKFKADDDGIIPILDKSQSEDDIVDRTVEFISKVRGESSLRGNLDWIAESLDSKSNKSSEEVIREYYNKGFYEDHCQTYQKRPIYWMFVSNPKNWKASTFKVLVYMHRYNKDTINIIRQKYLNDLQRKLNDELDWLMKNNGSQKNISDIQSKMSELKEYDNTLKNFTQTHQGTIDLDAGVKANYGMFMDAGIVAKI